MSAPRWFDLHPYKATLPVGTLGPLQPVQIHALAYRGGMTRCAVSVPMAALSARLATSLQAAVAHFIGPASQSLLDPSVTAVQLRQGKTETTLVRIARGERVDAVEPPSPSGMCPYRLMQAPDDEAALVEALAREPEWVLCSTAADVVTHSHAPMVLQTLEQKLRVPVLLVTSAMDLVELRSRDAA